MRDAPPPGLVYSDFDTIQAAVMETARGRWFLAEYARRNRMADTRLLLDAIARLDNTVTAGPPAQAGAPAPGALAATAAQIAERLADISWDLRERGFADDVCAAVDRQAAAVQGLAARLDGGGGSRADPPAPPLPQDRAAAPASLMRLPVPESHDAMRAALSRLDTLPLAARLEMFV